MKTRASLGSVWREWKTSRLVWKRRRHGRVNGSERIVFWGKKKNKKNNSDLWLDGARTKNIVDPLASLCTHNILHVTAAAVAAAAATHSVHSPADCLGTAPFHIHRQLQLLGDGAPACFYTRRTTTAVTIIV